VLKRASYSGVTEKLLTRVMAAAESSGGSPTQVTTPSTLTLWDEFLKLSELENFKHQHAEFEAILDYILMMKKGDETMPKPCHVVYAPRGLGKSTLLKKMAGHLPMLLNDASSSLPQVISVYCSIMSPKKEMASLVATIQHALPLDHAGRKCSSVDDLQLSLVSSNHVVAAFVDDVEHLYSEAAHDLAEESGADITAHAKGISPGVYVAKRWLYHFKAVAVPPMCGFRIMVVLCASKASVRRLLYPSVEAGKDEHLLMKYPLYPQVKTDLNNGKYKLCMNMMQRFWNSAEHFLKFLHDKGVVWPQEADDAAEAHTPLRTQAAEVFATSTATSLRCATVFAAGLRQMQHTEMLSAASIQAAALRVPSTQELYETADTEGGLAGVRSAVYNALIFRTGGRSLSAREVTRLQQQHGFAFDPSGYAMKFSELQKKCQVTAVQLYRALDEGILCYVDASRVGIPSLQQVLRFLVEGLDPYEAACLTHTAGAGGVNAEPIVGRALRSMLRASSAGRIAEGFLSTPAGAAWSSAVSDALKNHRVEVCDSELTWATVARFEVASKEPALPPGASEGNITFAKEHVDKYGGDLIAVIIPRASFDWETAGAAHEVSPGSDSDESATESTDVYLWRVQVKLCDTAARSIAPSVADQICTSLATGQADVEAALNKALGTAGICGARVHVLNSVATTRKVSQDARAVFIEKGVILLDRQALAEHWDSDVIQFAERASLIMYLPEV